MNSPIRVFAAVFVLGLLALLAGCGSGGSASSDWFYHWDCNGDPECLATNPTGAASGTADEGPNESSCTELLTFGNQFWGIPPATQSCDQNANGSSGGGTSIVTISSFSPASTAPGNDVTIDGSGFTSTTTVTINGITCPVSSVSATEIVCTVPGMGNFTGPIVVGGTSSTASISIVNHYFGVISSSVEAITVGGSTTVSGSTNGANWNTIDLSSADYLSAVATSASTTFVAVGQNGTIRLDSPGSASWASQTSGTSQNLFGVTWSGSSFAAVGAGGVILTSPDGVSWTGRTSHTSETLAAVAWCSSQFVAVGNDGVIDTSPDGITWTLRSSGTSGFLNAVGCSGSMIAVGEGSDSTGGGILSSPDGITWTPRALSSTDAVYGVTWSGTLFVAVGFSGTVYTSSNGTSWTARSSSSTDSLNAVTWSAAFSHFVAVGGFGTILISPDGVTWTSE